MHFKSTSETIPDYEANWVSIDPIVPFGVIAISVDTGAYKIGNGVDYWSDLNYSAGSIGGKPTDTSVPEDDEIPYFSDDDDKWMYRLQGIIDTETNWESSFATYPRFCVLIETDDSTHVPTGRIKFGDGSSSFASIPWIWVNTSEVPAGYSIEFNGTEFESARYQPYNELAFSVTPVGKFAKDDGTFDYPEILNPMSLVETDDLYALETITLGGLPVEPTSITLTSDGTYLYVDENKLIDINHDGHNCGFDADTLDTYHASSFATISHLHSYYVRYHGSLASAPVTNLSEGDEYRNTGDSKYYKYNGSTWDALN